MMDVETVTDISRNVAAQCDKRLSVIGVASTEGDTGRVELLVTIDGDQEPCIVMLNVTRSVPAAFEHDLREKFREALASHVTRN